MHPLSFIFLEWSQHQYNGRHFNGWTFRFLHRNHRVWTTENRRRHGFILSIQVSTLIFTTILSFLLNEKCAFDLLICIDLTLPIFFFRSSRQKRVSTHTSIPKFKAKQFSSMRRFSDFLGLHDLLVSKYLRLGRIIPPAPEKNLIGALLNLLLVIFFELNKKLCFFT